MKLKKFKEKNRKKESMIVFTIGCILLIGGVFFYSSFALFEVKENFNILKGNVESPGDLYFAYYVNDVVTLDMPKKDSGYTFSSKSSCNNGVTISFDEENWTARVNYSNYKQETSSRTKCTLYFEEKTFSNSLIACSQSGKSISTCLNENASLNEKELAYDETIDNNLRYIGSNPSNYVTFGETYETDIFDVYNSTDNRYLGLNLISKEQCENFKTTNHMASDMICQKTYSKGDKILWRIIGSMENIETSSGEKGSRIKIMRNDSIGSWSWDSTELNINNGMGINEWSVSDMKIVLNDYFYNGLTNQTCYVSSRETSAPCDFSKIKFPEKAKSMIEEVVWNTGSNNSNGYSKINTSKFYEYERSSNKGKICSSGDWCNDNIERTTKWTGKIGLFYPSDYGYATSGGNNTSRETCLNTNLSDWFDLNDCYQNNWFYNNGESQYSITPVAVSDKSFAVYGAIMGGVDALVASASDNSRSGIWSRPTIYLKPEVKITSGNGTSNNPYVLE